MSNSKNELNKEATQAELQDLVIETDAGARRPGKIAGTLIIGAALLWSLFQLWIASPLPFSLGIFVLDETKARYIHLTFAFFLAFTAYPALKKSPRNYIPVTDWVLAIVASFCAIYLYAFYTKLALRSGLPTNFDIIVSAVGVVLLLEATRRVLGPPLMIVAIIFLFYSFAGSWEYMPDLIRHKGQSLEKVSNHQWLSTEGVFGIALGVSTSFVFLFVLFGALLEKAGAGNYFIKVAFSLLGHMRGGPAKAAVLSSGMTGLISGSSIANVVTTGTFTVPLMRRVGFSREKAGAVEVASSVNGQMMPPVMGAAAFLMVEYIGIPYIEVVKHAFLPALISYIALLYIVHLEAMKKNMPVIPKTISKTLLARIITFGIVVTSLIILSMIVYLIFNDYSCVTLPGTGISLFCVNGLKYFITDNTIYIIAVSALIGLAYIGLLWHQSKYPELEVDDPNAPITALPEVGPTVNAGLHFILPIVVLVWCLMVERLSPGLSAFWATVLMMSILVTQRPIKHFFRNKGDYASEFKAGFIDLFDGLTTGARNMIGIGIATAAAGLIVGTVSLTGVGQVLTELVEVISGGSIILVLILTAVICLILGMGLPTTANYIVVASLMVPVVQELGVQTGLIVPAIAIHLFVFYFGIMADVTPPVGLASFAAAAVSGGDPIKTGLQAFAYSSRTIILPFLFIFNTELLLINVESLWHGTFVFLVSTVAILLFAASTQGYFIVKSRFYESLLLLLVAFTLFVPKFWVDRIIPPYEKGNPIDFEKIVGELNVGETLKVSIQGLDEVGDPRNFFVYLVIPEGIDGKDRLNNYGFSLYHDDGKVLIDSARYGTDARRVGLEMDFVIDNVGIPQVQPNKRLMYIPALLLLALVVISQRRRRGDNVNEAKKIKIKNSPQYS